MTPSTRPRNSAHRPGAWHRAGVARLTLGCLLALGMPSGAIGQDRPLSSIDWLSDSLAEEAALRPLRRAPVLAPQGAGVAPVSVTPLDVPRPDGIGVLPTSQSSLPSNLWGPTTTENAAARLVAFPLDPLPAARDALERLLLAELDPPTKDGTPGVLLLARIDTLLQLGALDAAARLLEATGTEEPELFRRAFDIALLQGREDAGCAKLQESPGVAPSLQARIFCLARSGDWAAAALTLDTAAALGQLSPVEDALLARFLDPALAEEVAPLARIPAPTPLEWRMLEAIGERQPTSGLPRAFAHADLRETAGWKTRLDATEKLVRAGALPASALRDVYGERSPAASGGVWDRVAAMQDLEHAMNGGTASDVGRALQVAWTRMDAAGLGLAFADTMASCLSEWPLEGAAARLAHRLMLLSADHAEAALSVPNNASPVALAFANGLDPSDSAAQSGSGGALTDALVAAFSATPPAAPGQITQLSAEGRFGEAILDALAVVALGADADPSDLSGALAFLRRVGLEDTARRAALQIYLLDTGSG